MLVSQYILLLKNLEKTHGDLECVDARGNTMPAPEYNDDEEPCFVLAEDG
jgi:hypothetical protein